MIKGKPIYLLTLIFLFLSLERINAQDFATDMKHINAVYEQIKEIDLKISYLLYPSHTSTRPIVQDQFELKQKGSLQLSRRGEIESLINDQYLIMVDHEDKSISVQASIKAESPFLSYPIPIDSMLDLYDSIHYKVQGAGLSTYSLYISDFMYEKVELFFYPHKHLIQKVVFYGAEKEEFGIDSPPGKPRYEIIYTKSILTPQFSSKTFSSTQFIEEREGKVYCASRFKQYQLINYLQ